MVYFDKDKVSFSVPTNFFSRAFTQGVDGLVGLDVVRVCLDRRCRSSSTDPLQNR